MRNLIGAFIGNRIDRRDGRGGVKGAAIDYVAQRVITRMGTPGLLLAGGYGLYRFAKDRRRTRDERV
nr:hypothetical protein [Sphingomonas gei]